MALKLEKKKPISLAKSISKMRIGLGWDLPTTGKPLDLDVTAIAIKADGKVQSPDDVCFYNQLTAAGGGLVSSGDNRSGAGEGDDETIIVDFSKLPSYASSVEVFVTIHEGKAKGQTFGSVKNSYAKIYNDETSEELFYIDLAESQFSHYSIHVASLVRGDNGWTVENVSNSLEMELGGILASYEVPIE